MLAPQSAQGLVARGSVKPGRGVVWDAVSRTGPPYHGQGGFALEGVSTPQEASRSAPEDYVAITRAVQRQATQSERAVSAIPRNRPRRSRVDGRC